MHPRNPYRTPPDFASLANSYPPLKAHLITDSSSFSGRKTIDFRNEDAQRRLTEAIMRHDFGVVMKIPEGRLCPPVPNRMNYVLWIQDIVYAHRDVLGTSSAFSSGSDSGSSSSSSSSRRKIRGLDIGTGSTAIYPILACKSQSWKQEGEEWEWEMVGTELDDLSYAYAQENVSSNNLQSRIKILKASEDGPILFPVESETFHFCMCNPPFYASKEEIEESAVGKDMPPSGVCTGAPIEMIYPEGGEAGFVGRMVQESVRLGVRCKWYTSMLGKMSSVSSIIQALKAHSITNYGITEFVQGQTRRWGVAWSFTDERLPDAVARISTINAKHPLYALMSARNTLVQPLALASSASLSSSSFGSREAGEVEAKAKAGLGKGGSSPPFDVAVEVAKVLEEVLDGIAGVTTTRVSLSDAHVSVPAHTATDELGSVGAAGAGTSSDAAGGDGDGAAGGDGDGASAGGDGAAAAAASAGARGGDASVPPSFPSTSMAFLVEAQENTWSRSARRKNRQPRVQDQLQAHPHPELPQPKLQRPEDLDLDLTQPPSSKQALAPVPTPAPTPTPTPTPTSAKAKAKPKTKAKTKMPTKMTEQQGHPIKPALTCSCRVVCLSSSSSSSSSFSASFPTEGQAQRGQKQELGWEGADGNAGRGGAVGVPGAGADGAGAGGSGGVVRSRKAGDGAAVAGAAAGAAGRGVAAVATTVGGVSGGDENTFALEFQWIYGSDRALYESFVGHVGRKVGAALKNRSGIDTNSTP